MNNSNFFPFQFITKVLDLHIQQQRLCSLYFLNEPTTYNSFLSYEVCKLSYIWERQNSLLFIHQGFHGKTITGRLNTKMSCNFTDKWFGPTQSPVSEPVFVGDSRNSRSSPSLRHTVILRQPPNWRCHEYILEELGDLLPVGSFSSLAEKDNIFPGAFSL